MSLEYRTVDTFGRILPVTHLRDAFDRPTRDPALAERCVVLSPDLGLVAMTCDEVPIYTVH